MDRQNKKCSCARKSERRKNNAGTDEEEEKKLAWPLAKKELPAEGYSRRYGKWEDSTRQKKISDDNNWVLFFRGFSSPVRRMSGSFMPTRSPNIIWPS